MLERVHTAAASRAFTPRARRADGRLTDMLSFYTLPSTVINNPQHSRLAAAFQYYTVPAATPLAQLMGDALVLAHSTCAAGQLW